TMAGGGVHGFPVVDVRVRCTDGKTHAVDSSDMAFRTAAALGFKDALGMAGAVVLEPISLLRVVVSAGAQGDIMSDISARRGKVQGTTANGNGEHEIVALVPASELIRYAIELRSTTGGRGRFSVEHDHYDVLPAHLHDRLAPRAAK
ncbi:MAG: elongation factor G, partial [Ilumatobacteraceae bacterium]